MGDRKGLDAMNSGSSPEFIKVFGLPRTKPLHKPHLPCKGGFIVARFGGLVHSGDDRHASLTVSLGWGTTGRLAWMR